MILIHVLQVDKKTNRLKTLEFKVPEQISRARAKAYLSRKPFNYGIAASGGTDNGYILKDDLIAQGAKFGVVADEKPKAKRARKPKAKVEDAKTEETKEGSKIADDFATEK